MMEEATPTAQMSKVDTAQPQAPKLTPKEQAKIQLARASRSVNENLYYLFLVVGVIVFVDFVLDLAVILSFAANRDVVWCFSSLIVTGLSLLPMIFVGLNVDGKQEHWGKAPGLLLTVSHLRFAAYGVEVIRSKRTNADASAIKDRFRDFLRYRGLFASIFMLALQIYVQWNSPSALLAASCTFSGIVVTFTIVARYCYRDSPTVQAWTVLHVASQVFVRVFTISILCTLEKAASLVLTIPMVIAAILFSTHMFLQHTSNISRAFWYAAVSSPLVLVVGVNPSFSSLLEPPFTTDEVRAFLVWRLCETAIAAVWSSVICFGTKVPLINPWVFLIFTILGTCSAIFSWFRLLKAEQAPERHLQMV